jgi:hypothetical protein
MEVKKSDLIKFAKGEIGQIESPFTLLEFIKWHAYDTEPLMNAILDVHKYERLAKDNKKRLQRLQVNGVRPFRMTEAEYQHFESLKDYEWLFEESQNVAFERPVDEVIDALKDIYPVLSDESIYKINKCKNRIDIFCNGIDHDIMTINGDNVKELARYFGWWVESYNSTYWQMTRLTIVARQTELVNNVIKNNYDNKVYALIRSNWLESVKRIGIFIDDNEPFHEGFNHKLYAREQEDDYKILESSVKYAADMLDVKLDLNKYSQFNFVNIANQMFLRNVRNDVITLVKSNDIRSAAIETIENDYNDEAYWYVAVEIDLNKVRIPIYKDIFCQDHFLFTNIDIPRKAISGVYDIKENKKLSYNLYEK